MEKQRMYRHSDRREHCAQYNCTKYQKRLLHCNKKNNTQGHVNTWNQRLVLKGWHIWKKVSFLTQRINRIKPRRLNSMVTDYGAQVSQMDVWITNKVYSPRTSILFSLTKIFKLGCHIAFTLILSWRFPAAKYVIQTDSDSFPKNCFWKCVQNISAKNTKKRDTSQHSGMGETGGRVQSQLIWLQ